MKKWFALLWGAAVLSGTTGCSVDDRESATPTASEPAARLTVSNTRAAGLNERGPGEDLRTAAGDQTDLFGAPVATWARLTGDGTAVEVGFSLSLAAVENAPTASVPGEEGYRVVLAFPPAVKATTFIDHLEIDWNPEGHPPIGVYTVPHFDFHFYGVGQEEVEAVDCSNMALPGADQIPGNYVLPPPGPPPEGGCVPMMGLHALDITSPELNPVNPAPFTRTMILGYYGGAQTFIEPMITREYLRGRQDFAQKIPVPSRLGKATRYPRIFTATYDASADAYRLACRDFVATVQ
jgi:hypothetical protein